MMSGKINNYFDEFIFDEMIPKTYVIDHGDDSFTIKIKKTLIVDHIPHQPPSLMGRVIYEDQRVLKFDFTVEKLPCFDEELIDITPCFNTSMIHVPLIIIDTIMSCIKSYYKDFLSSMK